MNIRYAVRVHKIGGRPTPEEISERIDRAMFSGQHEEAEHYTAMLEEERYIDEMETTGGHEPYYEPPF